MGIGNPFKRIGQGLWRMPNNVIGRLAGRGGKWVYDPQHETQVNIGGWLPRWMFQTTRTPALALGDVVLAAEECFLTPETYAHELGHVDQYRKLGPLFLPLYGLGALLGKIRGDAHDANPFEIDADIRAGLANRYRDKSRFWSSADRTLPKHRGGIDLS